MHYAVMLPWRFQNLETMIKQIRSLVVLLLTLVAGSPVHAQSTDLQAWSTFTVKQQLTKKLSAEYAAQLRFDENLSRLRGAYYSISVEYKLMKRTYLLGEFRYSTSVRWDRFRPGIGIQRSFYPFGKKQGELRARFLYQKQLYLHSDELYGLNPTLSNYRLRFQFDRKIARKTHARIIFEPLVRSKSAETYFSRYRIGVSIVRSLPGPWKMDVGFVRQENFPKRSAANMLRIGLQLDLYDLLHPTDKASETDSSGGE